MPSDGGWTFAEQLPGRRTDAVYYVLGQGARLRKCEYAERGVWGAGNEPGWYGFRVENDFTDRWGELGVCD